MVVCRDENTDVNTVLGNLGNRGRRRSSDVGASGPVAAEKRLGPSLAQWDCARRASVGKAEQEALAPGGVPRATPRVAVAAAARPSPGGGAARGRRRVAAEGGAKWRMSSEEVARMVAARQEGEIRGAPTAQPGGGPSQAFAPQEARAAPVVDAAPSHSESYWLSSLRQSVSCESFVGLPCDLSGGGGPRGRLTTPEGPRLRTTERAGSERSRSASLLSCGSCGGRSSVGPPAAATAPGARSAAPAAAVQLGDGTGAVPPQESNSSGPPTQTSTRPRTVLRGSRIDHGCERSLRQEGPWPLRVAGKSQGTIVLRPRSWSAHRSGSTTPERSGSVVSCATPREQAAIESHIARARRPRSRSAQRSGSTTPERSGSVVSCVTTREQAAIERHIARARGSTPRPSTAVERSVTARAISPPRGTQDLTKFSQPLRGTSSERWVREAGTPLERAERARFVAQATCQLLGAPERARICVFKPMGANVCRSTDSGCDLKETIEAPPSGT